MGKRPSEPHDLRRTFGTRLASLGVHAEDQAAVLNHKPTTITQIHRDVNDRMDNLNCVWCITMVDPSQSSLALN
jgi:integrase